MKVHRTLLFIFSVIALLTCLSVLFPEKGISFGQRRLFFPSLEEILVREKSQSAKAKLEALEESLRVQFVLDSTAHAEQMAYKDSLLFYTRFFNEHPARIYLPKNDLSFFDSLFYRLDNCLKNKELIHILHYGDSQIEADRITGFIRQHLQEKFGGNGPGLLPAVQPIPSASVGQTASENIERYTIAGNHVNKAEHNRYGILGQTAAIQEEGNVSITTRNLKTTFQRVKEFSRIRLFVSHNSPGFSASLQIGEKEPIVRRLTDESSHLRVLTWNLRKPIKKFTLHFSGDAEISAIALDGDAGVAVDNIPLRGSSGTFFTKIDIHSLLPALKELNVRLILMEFGGNQLPSIKNEKGVSYYKTNIAKQINHLKTIYPAAKIVLIGPADMSIRENGRLRTYPYLEKFVENMKEAALENGAAFWNMFEVMGGENAMVEWVNNEPAWAAPDYIHFTERGANKIAEMFCESWMIYYDYLQFITNSKRK